MNNVRPDVFLQFSRHVKTVHGSLTDCGCLCHAGSLKALLADLQTLVAAVNDGQLQSESLVSDEINAKSEVRTFVCCDKMFTQFYCISARMR